MIIFQKGSAILRVYKKYNIFLVIVLFLLITGCKKSEKQFEKQYLLMGTFLEIKVNVQKPYDKNKIFRDIDEAYKLGEHLQGLFSLYDEKSELSEFNRLSEGIYSISDEFMDLLLLCRDVYELSGGAFDPTIKPLVERWGLYHFHKTDIPENAELINIVNSIGFDKLEINSDYNIVVKKAGVELDFGGIGKGFAIDRMSGLLKDRGYKKFLVNLGGNMYVCNFTDDYEWRIGVKDPEGSSIPYKIIQIVNRGISTSASYYNFRTQDDIIISHIINPKTGYPVDHRLSVTIVAESAGMADGLSTAFAVLGIEGSSELAGKLNNVDGIIILSENGIYNEVIINNFKNLFK